ncbi:hypothetical protein BP6252_05448 [Coleophoma cylindrospora]|uniref:Uncharacterized protein n=1 Tax=Coleophoma cylindrospora TaxID=1849047 RepID=A0A3D8RTQ7_9HELO|nr:hypothetical protein BP6252_05448 [Coleophoma cylindrospora]
MSETSEDLTIQHDEVQIEEDEPVDPNTTIEEALNEFNDFAEEFSSFALEEELPTPQADFGIGPVKYDLHFPKDMELSADILKLLSELVDLERETGNRLVKVLATLDCLFYGKEDAFIWLPALERSVLRPELQETTMELAEILLGEQNDDIPDDDFEEILLECEKGQTINGAELAFVTELKFLFSQESYTSATFFHAFEDLRDAFEDRAEQRTFSLRIFKILRAFHTSVVLPEDRKCFRCGKVSEGWAGEQYLD